MQKVEELYPKFQRAIGHLQKTLNASFSSILTETFDNLENGKIKVKSGAPDKETVAELTEGHRQLDYDNLPRALRVQISTLLTLKTVTQDTSDYNLTPTPSMIATIVALIWQRIVSKGKKTMVDPTIGTGNLLCSVIRQLIQENHSQNNYKLIGTNNEEALLDLADIGVRLGDLKIDLYCQDALDPWMIKKADIAVSDVSVGYYSLDNNAERFGNHAKEGYSSTHTLFIEQVVNSLKRDGFAFLVAPRLLFTDKGSTKFTTWLAKKVNIQAIVDLSDDIFSNQIQQKFILVFQNHGEHAIKHEILVAKLDSLKKPESLVAFNMKLDDWYHKSED